MAMRLYKIVGLDGGALHGGSGRWHLPTRKDRPAKWMPAIKEVRACHSGYHLVSRKGLAEWIPSCHALLCEAEGRGESHSEGRRECRRVGRRNRMAVQATDQRR